MNQKPEQIPHQRRYTDEASKHMKGCSTSYVTLESCKLKQQHDTTTCLLESQNPKHW